MTRDTGEGAPKRLSKEERAVLKFSETDLQTAVYGTHEQRIKLRGPVNQGSLFASHRYKDKPLQEAARAELERRAAEFRGARVREFGLGADLSDQAHSDEPGEIYSSLAVWRLQGVLHPGAFNPVGVQIRIQGNIGMKKYFLPLVLEGSELQRSLAAESVRDAFAAKAAGGMIAGLMMALDSERTDSMPDASIQMINFIHRKAFAELALDVRRGKISSLYLEQAAVAVGFAKLTAAEREAIAKDTSGTAAALAFAKSVYGDTKGWLALDPRRVSDAMKGQLKLEEQRRSKLSTAPSGKP